MILIDVNVLLYARNVDAAQHAASRSWLDLQLSGATPVGLPWASLLEFLRIATNQRLFREPLMMAAAWAQVTSWLSAEPVWTPAPTERHAAVLAGLLALPGVHGNLVFDAHPRLQSSTG